MKHYTITFSNPDLRDIYNNPTIFIKCYSTGKNVLVAYRKSIEEINKIYGLDENMFTDFNIKQTQYEEADNANDCRTKKEN